MVSIVKDSDRVAPQGPSNPLMLCSADGTQPTPPWSSPHRAERVEHRRAAVVIEGCAADPLMVRSLEPPFITPPRGPRSGLFGPAPHDSSSAAAKASRSSASGTVE